MGQSDGLPELGSTGSPPKLHSIFTGVYTHNRSVDYLSQERVLRRTIIKG